MASRSSHRGMSRASESKRMIEAVAGYSLMSVPQAAEVLDVSADTLHVLIEAGRIPAIPVGERLKIDPIDVAVHILAAKEGVAPAEYRARYGDAVVATNARRYFMTLGIFMGAA